MIKPKKPTVELLQEQIAHLETRRMLWLAQGQLLAINAQKSVGEMTRLQSELQQAQDALKPEPSEPLPA